MKEKESEFEQDRNLDIHNLHEEFQKQSNLYGKWASRKASAAKEKKIKEDKLKALQAETKADLERKRAELDFRIRQYWDNPDMWGWDSIDAPEFDKKPTESAITSWIILHPDFRQLQNDIAKQIKEVSDDLAESVENYEYLEGAVLSMSHRKAAIEGEITLWINEYYSDPNVPKALKEQAQKSTQEKIRKSLKIKKED